MAEVATMGTNVDAIQEQLRRLASGVSRELLQLRRDLGRPVEDARAPQAAPAQPAGASCTGSRGSVPDTAPSPGRRVLVVDGPFRDAHAVILECDSGCNRDAGCSIRVDNAEHGSEGWFCQTMTCCLKASNEPVVKLPRVSDRERRARSTVVSRPNLVQGSRVRILGGELKGQLATILERGRTDGKLCGGMGIGRCDVRIDGARSGSQWCYETLLQCVFALPGAPRVALPGSLSDFKPGPNGPPPRMFVDDSK